MPFYKYKKKTIYDIKDKEAIDIAQFKARNLGLTPVRIEGRQIAKSWWGKAWNKKTIIFIIAIIIIISFVGNFTNILDSMLEETQYKNVVLDWQESQDDGTNIFRVLVYAVPSILSLVGLRYIKEADNPLINLCTNMSIVAVGFYVISMFTSGIFIGRLPIYFSLYSYI